MTSQRGPTFLPPPGCPRQRDGGDGPRLCKLTSCRLHLPRGEDDCTLDYVDRTRARGDEPALEEIGGRLGVVKSTVKLLLARAIAKVRVALGVSVTTNEETDMPSSNVRAKMRCILKSGNDVQLEAVVDEDNKTWAKHTPSGTLRLHIDNPPALERFELGKRYFVDFTEAPAAEADEIR